MRRFSRSSRVEGLCKAGRLCHGESMARVPSIIVHGGAGADPTDGLDELRDGVRAAVEAGWRILSGGGRALDAVEIAVRALEDLPRLHAGRGAGLNSTRVGGIDASLMGCE